MKFLANENVPWEAIQTLRRAALDVAWVKELYPGARDHEILQRARQENRILITFDKDFGELIFRQKEPTPPGVLLLRFRPQSPQMVSERLTRILQQKLSWEGSFAVATESQVRIVPLPRST